MLFLGIDQSLRSTGVAVISKEQEVRYTGTVTPGKLTGVSRLVCIRNALREVIGLYPGIHYAALEGYSIGSVNRSFDLGELGGLVRIVLHDEGIPALIVPPTSLKQFVTGNGSSDKDAMRRAVLKKWGIDINQDDICDAFGLAQVARSFHLSDGTTRAELEVLKKLKSSAVRPLSLVAYSASSLSV